MYSIEFNEMVYWYQLEDRFKEALNGKENKFLLYSDLAFNLKTREIVKCGYDLKEVISFWMYQKSHEDKRNKVKLTCVVDEKQEEVMSVTSEYSWSRSSSNEGCHVRFPKGRKDFLSMIADNGTIFQYYEGREDSLESVDYKFGYVSFYNGKTGWVCYEDLPLWIKEYDWEDRWYNKNYEIGEHNYTIDLEDSIT